MKAWHISLFVGASLILFMLLASRGRRPPPTPVGEGEKTVAESPAHAPVVAAPASRESSPAPDPALDPAPDPAPAPTPEEITEAPPPEPAQDVPPPVRGGFLTEMRDAYQSSSADAGAAAAEAEIFALLKGREDLAVLDAVTCHAQVCRIRMAWSRKTPTSLMAVHMILGEHISEHLAVDPQGDGEHDDPLPLELFILRKGLSMSDLN